MATDDGWKLPRPGDSCAACRAPLRAGAACTTVVRMPAEGPVREDLCAACGEVAVADAEVLFWRRRVPEASQQRAVVDYAMLRELFGRMLLRPDDVYRRLSYLVALVLIRKRHLRLVGFQRRAGREVLVVTRGAGQPAFDVPAPLLTAEDLLVVRDQLARLLNTDLAEHDLPELAALRAAPVPETAPADGADGADGPEAAAGAPAPAAAGGERAGIAPGGGRVSG